MTEAEREQLSEFEARIRHLIFLHNEQKSRYAKLEQLLNEKELQIANLKEELQILTQNHADLKQALAISLDGSDINETKKVLSQLVREVDTCISMLINE